MEERKLGCHGVHHTPPTHHQVQGGGRSSGAQQAVKVLEGNVKSANFFEAHPLVQAESSSLMAPLVVMALEERARLLGLPTFRRMMILTSEVWMVGSLGCGTSLSHGH